MRVAVDAHVLDGRPQGTRTWLLETVSRAIPLTPHIEWLIYSHDQESFAPFQGFANAAWRRIPFRRASARLGLFWPAVLLRRQIDLALFQYHGPPLLRRRQVPVIHDLMFESHPQFFPAAMRWRLRLLVRHAVARAETVVVPSAWTRRELLRLYGVPEERVFLAPNGYAAGPPPARQSDGRTVLFVGRIEPRKNLDLLVDAVARMRTPDRRLVVVGTPDFRSAASCARLAGLPWVAHRQDVSAKELRALYATAAVLGFPSAGEGFGIPIIEALNAGLPVVASDTTAIPDTAGDFASFFDPHAPDAAERLARLLDEAIATPKPVDRAALSQHLAQFDWQASARALVEAVERARHRAGSPSAPAAA